MNKIVTTQLGRCNLKRQNLQLVLVVKYSRSYEIDKIENASKFCQIRCKLCLTYNNKCSKAQICNASNFKWASD